MHDYRLTSELGPDGAEPKRSRRLSRLRPKHRRLSLIRSVAVLAWALAFIVGTASLARGAWDRLNPKEEVSWFGPTWT